MPSSPSLFSYVSAFAQQNSISYTTYYSVIRRAGRLGLSAVLPQLQGGLISAFAMNTPPRHASSRPLPMMAMATALTWPLTQFTGVDQ